MHKIWRIADNPLPTEVNVCGWVDMSVLVSYTHVKGKKNILAIAVRSRVRNTHVIVLHDCRLTELLPISKLNRMKK